MKKQQVISEIKSYIEANNSIYSNWYVGITNDPEKRLFSEHNVDKVYGKWIYCPCDSNNDAREVENYFVNTLKTDGGEGGGDLSSRYVYGYLKTTTTRE